MAERICSILDCERPHRAKGIALGITNGGRSMASLVCLVAGVVPESTSGTELRDVAQMRCWEWAGSRTLDGYGQQSGKVLAHRFAYEALVGPIPEGLTIDHLCRNRACVNPNHLEPVSNRANILRGVSPTAINARKTHCIRGHLFDSANTGVDKNGWRTCRKCRRIRERKRGK